MKAFATFDPLIKYAKFFSIPFIQLLTHSLVIHSLSVADCIGMEVIPP